jgi:hypothetical protein
VDLEPGHREILDELRSQQQWCHGQTANGGGVDRRETAVHDAGQRDLQSLQVSTTTTDVRSLARGWDIDALGLTTIWTERTIVGRVIVIGVATPTTVGAVRGASVAGVDSGAEARVLSRLTGRPMGTKVVVQTNCFRILHRTSHLGNIVRAREWLLTASVWASTGGEDLEKSAGGTQL